MASSILPSYPIQHDQQQQRSDYFTYASASASAMNIPGTAGLTSRYTSQQDDKSMTRECLLFPTYAFRNPNDPSEWVIRTRGWALSHNRSGAKQKFVTSISKGVVGQNSGDHATFEQRFKYFLAKNKRNKQFIIQAAGTHSLPSDSWHSSPLSSFTSSPSSSSADLFDNNNNNTMQHQQQQQQHRRDSDGSTDSGFQSSGVTDKDDYFYYHYDQSLSDQGDHNFNASTTAALFAMERPANPLSSILSGRRMQSTTSIPSSLSSNNSNDSKQYHGDNDDDDDYNDDEQEDDAENVGNINDDDELPSNHHYLTINTTNSDSSTATMSSLFTYPSFTSTMTSPTFSSSASDSTTTTKNNNNYINKVDGQAIFKSESSGFFTGPTHLSHRKVLQWAKEKDYCDARLLQIKSTPCSNNNNKDHHPHHGMDPNAGAPFPTSTGMVNLIEPTGISIISDIDDTIKETQILHGARTVLSNTFFKESRDISGMAETYMKWYTQGASFHYVSNSPFQLLPFLHDFLNTTQFPPGSMHLRLDGSILARLIEIPGRAKRDSILGIMRDFPNRQFVLVGDSGEIDLEIYTKIAVENPGRILKIFIHDVTTPYAMQKKRAKKSTSTTTTTESPTDTISSNNGLPSLLRNNSMSFSSLFQTTTSNNNKRHSFDTHPQRQQRPVSLQSTSSSPSLLEATEEISKNKSNSLLELASSIASSSVLGLGRGRTKTLAELVIEPSLSPSTSTTSSTSSYTITSGSGSSSSSSTLPPSQQCMQLYDRVQKAQEQLPNVDIVLFQNADELRDDTTIQKALWQQWDDQCLNNNTPII